VSKGREHAQWKRGGERERAGMLTKFEIDSQALLNLMILISNFVKTFVIQKLKILPSLISPCYVSSRYIK
jgi:hypothetical protein